MRIVFVLAVFAWVVGQSVVALAGASVGKAEPFELVKGPDGTIYKITAAQLEGIAKSEGPKPPCKIKDCYSILAFGKQRTVPVKALNAYIVSPDQAKALPGELMKIGKALRGEMGTTHFDKSARAPLRLRGVYQLGINGF